MQFTTPAYTQCALRTTQQVPRCVSPSSPSTLFPAQPRREKVTHTPNLTTTHNFNPQPKCQGQSLSLSLCLSLSLSLSLSGAKDDILMYLLLSSTSSTSKFRVGGVTISSLKWHLKADRGDAKGSQGEYRAPYKGFCGDHVETLPTSTGW